MVNRILLIAQISSPTAVVRFFQCQAVGVTLEVGPGERVTLRLLVVKGLSAGNFNRSVWVTDGGSVTLDRGTGNQHLFFVNSPVLGDHVTSWD